MKTFVVLLFSILVACSTQPKEVGGDAGAGGTDSGGGGCSGSLSGAATASYPGCMALGAWDGSKNTSTFSVTPQDASNTDVGPTARVDVVGMLTTGTFKDTDANASGVVLYVDTSSTSSVPQWAASVGALAGAQGHQGSYTLTLTSVAASVTTTSVIDYDVHGTLTATLVPIAGTGATGNIDYTITF